MTHEKSTHAKKPRLEHIVCKPCWELKYCPYGPLVEFFPLIHDDDVDLNEKKVWFDNWIEAVREGDLSELDEIYKAIEAILYLRPGNWEWISQYRTDELSCSIFGHICPVFFSAEPLTETREERRTTRTIPRAVMLQVVRRDGQICRMCQRNVPDNEVEFDHVIPYSRGGPTSAENLRLVCRSCNRRKKDSLADLIDPDPLGFKSETENDQTG